MALDENRFRVVRPFLYHLTSRDNLGMIRTDRALYSATTLLRNAGKRELCRVRRKAHLTIESNGTSVQLRDQMPLHRGPIALTDGFSYEDFVELVNGLVFFWPGDESNPITHGQRHMARYRHEDPVVLRIPTSDIIGDGNLALYSRCNSGAPRCSRGVYAPRGPSTFVAADQFDGTPGKVVEVVFRQFIRLPKTTVVKPINGAEWKRLSVRRMSGDVSGLQLRLPFTRLIT